MAVTSSVIAQESVAKAEILEAVTLAIDADGNEIVEPITLEQAKKHLKLEGVLDDEDDQILGMITAAREMAEGKLNRTLVRRVLEVAASAWGPIRLLKPPFVQIESVSYFNEDGELFEIDSSDLSVSSVRVPATVSLRYGFQPPQLARQDEPIIVRYTAGYEPGAVPQPIVTWMLLQIGSMYAHRESVIAGVSVTPLPEMYEHMFLQPYMVYE